MSKPDGYQLRVMPPDEVFSSWHTVSELLEKSIQFCYGEFETVDIKSMVANREAFILSLDKGGETVLAAACQIIVLPRKKVMNVIALGGRDLEILYVHFWDEIQRIAKVLEVDAVRGAVRPAMQRYYLRIAPNDFTAYTILEKRV